MRLLVACTACKLQYDATGRRIGLRFRCRCGTVVSIQRPKGHDADVVHCSACGAAREECSTACEYCGADFTIHETDLETICPGCLARVSDRARYCHHCSTPLTADVVAGNASPWSCPSCSGKRLVSRRLPDPTVTALECRVCAGLWIGLDAFHELLNAEERQPRPVAAAHRGPALEQPRGFRPCPQCTGLMVRRNLGRGESGIIVDACGEHGLWFDDDELSRVIAWLRTGGLEAARGDVAQLKSSPDVQRKRRGRAAERKSAAQPPARPLGQTFERRDKPFGSDLQGVLEALAVIFSWTVESLHKPGRK